MPVLVIGAKVGVVMLIRLAKIARMILPVLLCALSQHCWLVSHHCWREDACGGAGGAPGVIASQSSALHGETERLPINHSEHDLPEPHQHGRGPVIAYVGDYISSYSKVFFPSVDGPGGFFLPALYRQKSCASQPLSQTVADGILASSVVLIQESSSFLNSNPSQAPPFVLL